MIKQLINKNFECIFFSPSRTIRSLRDFLIGINWQQHPLIDDFEMFFQDDFTGQHIEYSIISQQMVKVSKDKTDEYKQRLHKNISALRSSTVISYFDDLLVDIFDIICHLWISREDKNSDYIELSADDFLFLRGLKKKNNGSGNQCGYQKAQRMEIDRRLLLLCKIKYYWVSRSNEKSSGIVIDFEKINPFCYRIQLSSLLKSFMAKSRLHNSYPLGILQLDYKKSFWAKRIARNFYYNIKDNNQQSYSTEIVNVMNSIHPKYIREIKKNRLCSLLDKNLDLLRQMSIITGYVFEVKDSNLRMGKKSGLDKFVNNIVLVASLNPDMQNSHSKGNVVKNSKNTDINNDIIKDLITYIGKQNCTLESLSKDIGINRKSLSGYIKHNKNPNNKNSKIILDYLNNQVIREYFVGESKEND